MTAGAELDALIGRHVMQREPDLLWHVMNPEGNWHLISGDKGACEYFLEDTRRRLPDSEYAGYHVGSSEKWPPYSASIADAWRVVEAMRKRGFHFLLMATHESSLCIASFYLGPHDRVDASRTNHEAPEAICRAAVAALSESPRA